ncbi:MAG TPA: AraC family transcriptional regulator [Caulobacteraceae bacterium]|nr:AraC family transcriptional regulator [Caulobacteraceae bacterium]
MSLTDEALWIIDRNLGAELTLGSIAAGCGVSHFHLAHAFARGAGMSVMDYVRARRLTEAAEALARGASSILDVALEAGYASHEAFTRAFKARFGLTPDAVRRRASTEGLALTGRLAPLPANAAILPPPGRVRLGERLVVGLAAETSFADAIREVPVQWRRFASLGHLVDDRAEPMAVGVMSAVREDGRFDYLCGFVVHRFDALPAGLSRLRIAPADYAVFAHPGHIASLPATYAAIWNDALPQAGLTVTEGPLIERHGSSFDAATGLGGVEIWVPVTARP